MLLKESAKLTLKCFLQLYLYRGFKKGLYISARAGTKLQECPDYTSRVTIRSKKWGGRDLKIGTFGGMLLEFVKNFETCTLNRYFQVLKTHLI